MKIPFKKTYYDKDEVNCVQKALLGEMDYGVKSKEVLCSRFPDSQLFLTSSASTAFDLLFAALDLPQGSEVILPSFTYPSAANTLLRYGLLPVFADIDAQTKVLDLADVQSKLTDQTRCVIPTHYGGASVDMDELRAVCPEVLIIEDAALAFDAAYKQRPLGSIGDFGIISFHHTKNVSSDQGGVLIINTTQEPMFRRIQTLYDIGTDKADFFAGKVAAYSWQSAGLDVTLPNINAAVLCAQLKKSDDIRNKQMTIWQYYYKALSGHPAIALPVVPAYNEDNFHVFYIMLRDLHMREKVRKRLASNGIGAHFHYMPLHASLMGKTLGYKRGDLPITMQVSDRLLRLPVYAGLSMDECKRVVSQIWEAVH